MPVKSEIGMIHRTSKEKILKKEIAIAVATLTRVPIIVPISLAKGIKRAMKNGTNKGAVNKFTTRCTISNKFPSTIPMNELITTIIKPTIIEIN